MPHFTLSHGPPGPIIDVFVGVSLPRYNALLKAGQIPPEPKLIKALVDTGASHTAIDPTVIASFDLQSRRIAKTLTPSTGTTPHKCLTYDISIHIPLGSVQSVHALPAWEVSCVELKHQGFDMLLGRDILADAILVFNGKISMFSMAF
jgi:hypothetical protein